MKKLIAGLIAGLVLGTAGTGVAATSLYWARSGNDYRCTGIAAGVTCKSGGYEIGTTDSYVYIRKQGSLETAPSFACPKWSRWSACFE